ncbi:unnamed protein product [Angiostrongylus costaricensis]|uniref:P/Homo B domain-containing protein n=1 Tax=Angiostrongylus costaricensis TaxID=334426 RepID=A0A158PIM1_ANGCS|nr:unnamed protein product [Angiostrongylus costaricensis]
MKVFTPVLVIFASKLFSIISAIDDRLNAVLESLLKSDEAFGLRFRFSDDDSRERHRFAVEVDATDWLTVQRIARSSGFVIEDRIRWAEYLKPLHREKRITFIDPLYASQLQSWSTFPKMSIAETWAQGLSGKGVTIAVLDDGIESTHDDLRGTFDPTVSYDFISRRADVTPNMIETHGTRCAGIISMTANNSRCGVGIAYNSRMGGLVVLKKDQYLNDAIEGDALAYKINDIDIYSVSWGPADDGRTAELPGPLAQKALENGVMHIVIGVATSSGLSPWYAEECSAIIASISESSSGMVTTDVDNKCASISGSSAAASFAAAILALALEANPSLTQRDVQHLIVHTSDSSQLMAVSPEHWIINGAGRSFSRRFGFGVLNPLRLTTSATQWKSVPVLTRCSRKLHIVNGTFTASAPLLVDLPFNGCSGTSGEVNWIERLQLDVSLAHPRRGLISLLLSSPFDFFDQLGTYQVTLKKYVVLTNYLDI